METLKEKLERAETIVKSQKARRQKDMELAGIMTDMEGQYQIPAMQDPEWDAAHPDVIATYRQIGNMRSL